MSARRPLSDRIAELRANGPRPVNYERIEPQAWGPADVVPEQVRLLRGRVLVEPLEAVQSSLIVLVDSGKHDQKSLAIGLVVALGPPMLTKHGHEVSHGFEVGDVVLHVGQHRSRDVELADGKYRSVAQEEVQGVVEGDISGIDVKHGGRADYRTVIR